MRVELAIGLGEEVAVFRFIGLGQGYSQLRDGSGQRSQQRRRMVNVG